MLVKHDFLSVYAYLYHSRTVSFQKNKMKMKNVLLLYSFYFLFNDQVTLRLIVCISYLCFSKSQKMFGDLFGQRADYSDGMFYAGHRKYLNTMKKSGLEPPNEFKTKRQFKSAKRLENQDNELGENVIEKMSFHINFQKKIHESTQPNLSWSIQTFKLT